jgi:MoaA/NifB/PqqE/SkfB family radical SAM enzyme
MIESTIKFNRNKTKILHLETSNVCNAACPMCLRETDPTFDKKKHNNLTVDHIKKSFSDDFIKNLDHMFMCGNYGDPASAPECIEIFKYFRNLNSSMMLGIHSNGSLRNTSWWYELGKVLSNERDYCYFGIDGLRDTNHIYRVNTDFDKIMENAAAFISSGGKAHWIMLVFEHNEHQVNDAIELSKKMGFVGFQKKVTRRFNLEKWPHLQPPKFLELK